MSNAEPASPIEYRDIPGFPGYRVGDDGSVWSRRPRNGKGAWPQAHRRLRPVRHRTKLVVVLTLPPERYTRSVHRLVLEAFVGPRPPGMEACHWNGDPTDNRLSNLRWDTHLSNVADAIRHGTQPTPPPPRLGEAHLSAKLDAERVREVRRLGGSGMSISALARMFAVSRPSIRAIVDRRSWRHVL